jgi:hypothetical protein
MDQVEAAVDRGSVVGRRLGMADKAREFPVDLTVGAGGRVDAAAQAIEIDVHPVVPLTPM